MFYGKKLVKGGEPNPHKDTAKCDYLHFKNDENEAERVCNLQRSSSYRARLQMWFQACAPSHYFILPLILPDFHFPKGCDLCGRKHLILMLIICRRVQQ